jgi:small conductance mechanosensitive channel
MKRRIVLAVVLSSVVLALAIGAAPAICQEQEVEVDQGPQGSDLQVEAQELLRALHDKSEEFAGLRELMADSSGDDARALRKRGGELIEEALADLELLADNVVTREQVGEDASEDRERVSAMMRRGWVFFRDLIERDVSELKELRRSKDEAPPEDLADLDNRIALAEGRFDRVLENSNKLVATMEDFGLTCSEERTFLGDQLSRRAELLAGRILVAKDEIRRLEKRLGAMPDNADLSAELDLETQKLDGQIERLKLTSGMMADLGLDTSEYRQLLFEVTGEITTGLFSRQVITGLTRQWAGNARDWVAQNGPGVAFKIVLFLLILLVFRILSKIARKIVAKAIRSSTLQVSQLLERTALSVTGAVVMILGLLVALSQLGFHVGPLVAGLGVAGFIIGFALQDTLSNFASGVMILLYRPYDVGDLIETAGATGKVEDMTLVSTTILTVDHQTLVIPNSMIWGNVIKNVTAQTERRIDMVFGIGYADDIPHAERVLREILEAHDKVLEEPEAIVKLHNLNDSSVDFVVRPWVATDDYWDVYWDITREVKIRFDAEGISIPFPQRDVHVFREDGGAGD